MFNEGVGIGVAVAVGVDVGVGGDVGDAVDPGVGEGVGVDVAGRSSVIVATVAALPRNGRPKTCSIVRKTLKWLYVVATFAWVSHGAAAAV